MDAFAALPELKKYAKKYEEGNRDKEFLDQYFILKDKSALVVVMYYLLFCSDR